MKIHTVIVVDLICSKMQKGFREQSLRKTVSFKLVFIILQIVCNTLEKNVYKHLTVCSMGFFLLHVPCSLERNKQKKIFLCNKHKNLLSSWIRFEMKTHQSGCRFENWWISLGWYSQILPSFNWGIFSHVLHLNQLSVRKIILWIIYMHTLWTDVWLITLIYHTHMMFLLFAIQPNNQEESFWETQSFSLSCCFLRKK